MIRGGQVLDGTGADAVQTDIGIREDRIVFIGDSAKAQVQAARMIDGRGGAIISPATVVVRGNKIAVAGSNVAIPADATVLVLVYVNQTVQARHAFTAATPLDDAAIQAILGDANKVIGASK